METLHAYSTHISHGAVNVPKTGLNVTVGHEESALSNTFLLSNVMQLFYQCSGNSIVSEWDVVDMNASKYALNSIDI